MPQGYATLWCNILIIRLINIGLTFHDTNYLRRPCWPVVLRELISYTWSEDFNSYPSSWAHENCVQGYDETETVIPTLSVKWLWYIIFLLCVTDMILNWSHRINNFENKCIYKACVGFNYSSKRSHNQINILIRPIHKPKAPYLTRSKTLYIHHVNALTCE